MKKMNALFLVLIMLFSVLSVAFAQDDTGAAGIDAGDVTDVSGTDSVTDVEAETDEEATEEEAEEVEEEAIDEETEEEVELISESNFGATVRLLQLEKAVTKSYLIGMGVISVLSEKGEDVAELESILAEIEVLKDEVSNLDPNSENAVDDFVNIKRDIKDLNREFRKIASPLLTANDKQSIRDSIKDNDELASLNQEIRDALRELNANRVEKALDRMGVSDPELIEKIESGDATRAEVKDALKSGYQNLDPELKAAARLKLRNAVKERVDLRKKVVEKVKLGHLEVRKARYVDRLKKIPVKKRVLVKKRINTKVKRLNKVENRIKDKIQVNRAKLTKIKQDIKTKRVKVREDFKKRAVVKGKAIQRKQNINDRRADVVGDVQAQRTAIQERPQASTDTAGGDVE